MDKIVIFAGGFMVGLLCGLIPLVLGFLVNRTFIGLLGTLCSAIGAALYANMGKSPWTSLAIAVLFVLFIVLSARKKSSSTSASHTKSDDAKPSSLSEEYGFDNSDNSEGLNDSDDSDDE